MLRRPLKMVTRTRAGRTLTTATRTHFERLRERSETTPGAVAVAGPARTSRGFGISRPRSVTTGPGRLAPRRVMRTCWPGRGANGGPVDGVPRPEPRTLDTVVSFAAFAWSTTATPPVTSTRASDVRTAPAAVADPRAWTR